MRPPPGAFLAVHTGLREPTLIVLDGTRHVLGREPYADVDLDNIYVSRRHAEITFSGGAYSIRDLGSKNGTFVDGRRLRFNAERLNGGEVVELGRGQVVAGFRLGSDTVTLSGDALESGRRPPMEGSDTARLCTSASGPSGRRLFVDTGLRRVFVAGRLLSPPLSRRQFDILALLWERGGEACHRQELAAKGWPDRPVDDVSDREISQCVYLLRKRIEAGPSTPKPIISIRGYGYRLSETVWLP